MRSVKAQGMWQVPPVVTYLVGVAKNDGENLNKNRLIQNTIY